MTPAFLNLGEWWVSAVGGIGIVAALALLAFLVGKDGRENGIRGAELYGIAVFFLAPLGLVAWALATVRHRERSHALVLALAIAVFNVVYALTFFIALG